MWNSRYLFTKGFPQPSMHSKYNDPLMTQQNQLPRATIMNGLRNGFCAKSSGSSFPIMPACQVVVPPLLHNPRVSILDCLNNRTFLLGSEGLTMQGIDKNHSHVEKINRKIKCLVYEHSRKVCSHEWKWIHPTSSFPFPGQ